MQTINDRIESGKKFVRKNAHVITAAAAVVTAFATVRIQRDLHSAGQQITTGLRGDARVVTQCIDEGRDFTYLPGLGVHVHPKTPTEIKTD